MPEFLNGLFTTAPEVSPARVFVRLLVALALGWLVALTYRKTRSSAEIQPSFSATLVLLSVLIAMVTQVIGDNVARAFSLVGALSIVRFRTAVRDTEDTAYVIFAVAIGMAVGASDLWVAGLGLAMVGLAAWLVSARSDGGRQGPPDTFLLRLRFGLQPELKARIAEVLGTLVETRRLMAMSTARQGLAIDETYAVTLVRHRDAADIVRTLNGIDGIEGVALTRDGFDRGD